MSDEITLAMVAGIGLRTLARVIHAYPPRAEGIGKAADAYNPHASDADDPIAAAALAGMVRTDEAGERISNASCRQSTVTAGQRIGGAYLRRAWHEVQRAGSGVSSGWRVPTGATSTPSRDRVR